MRRISGYVHSFSTLILLVAAFGCAGADAQTLVHFDLPAQPLAQSLKAIGTATNTDVGFSASQVAGLLAPPLKADLTVDGALTRVLAGTGLRPRHLDDHTIVIAASQSSRSDSAEKKSLPVKVSTLAKLGGQIAAPQDPPQSDSADTSSSLGEPKTPLAEIVVTGTNIRSEAPVGATIRTLDRVEIEQSGYATTQELIQSLPQNFRGGASGAAADTIFQSGANRGYNNSAGSGVNLRGLGNTATLVLVNGHRVASSSSGYFTDISTIPLSAIDHIDVLSDGASAIYGSEAIAGVVNIVLRKDSRGIETGVRYDIADGGFSTYGGNVQIGSEWTGGGYTLGGDFVRQKDLDASERPFTASIASPTSILPSYHQAALSAAVQQHFGDRLEAHGDAQYADKTVNVDNALYGANPFIRGDTRVKRWSASVGARFNIAGSWIVRYDAAGGQEVDDILTDFVFRSRPASGLSDVRSTTRFTDQTIGLSGEVLKLPAGPVKLAVGAAYRTEKYIDAGNYFLSTPPYSLITARRDAKSGYGEIRVPIVSELNAVPGIDMLTISIAGRIDDYSDFGTTVNPKYGISWSPIASLEIRGAYSTSFRAPATGTELANGQHGITTVEVLPFAGPGESAPVPGVVIFGGAPNLQPERARNITLGVDWTPVFAPDLRLAVNYYDISYMSQVAVAPYSSDPVNTPALASVVTYFPANAPLLALVNKAVANGAIFGDYTGGLFGPNALASALYLFDQRTRNLSSTKTSGFDLTARYHFALGAESIDTRLDATRIDKFNTTVIPGSPQLSEVNTIGYPARLRLRGLANWTHGDFAASIAANYVAGYPDTSAPNSRDVSPYTTIDLSARYTLHCGLKLSVAVANVFDRLPPYVYSGSPFFPNSHYDAANASPIGRIATFSLVKSW